MASPLAAWGGIYAVGKSMCVADAEIWRAGSTLVVWACMCEGRGWSAKKGVVEADAWRAESTLIVWVCVCDESGRGTIMEVVEALTGTVELPLMS